MIRVEVYKNLHNGLMSVREAHGKVLTHENAVFVNEPRFVVQPAGRSRVVEEKRKNVHAFVRGELKGFSPGSLTGFDDYTEWKQASYNPYKGSTFYDRETGEALISADKAVVTTEGVYYR